MTTTTFTIFVNVVRILLSKFNVYRMN